MYQPIDVFTYEKESVYIGRYKAAKFPINELDRILNYTDLPKKKKLIDMFSEDEIVSICLRPWKATIEQISLISAIYEMHMDTITLLCMEAMALMLYHTKSGSSRTEAFKAHLDLREQVYQESRLSQGFRRDLQTKGQASSQSPRTFYGTAISGYSVKL